MSILSDNLRYLRAQKKCSQQHVANALLIARGRYAKYEDEKSEPPIAILLLIAKYFEVSIDLLLVVDLRDIPDGERNIGKIRDLPLRGTP
jgi:transcriptional regulator with XRE-family HTH domain